MRTAPLLATLVALHATPLAAQTPDEKAALAAVVRVFEGMRTADTVMLRSALADGVRFAVVGTREVPDRIAYETVDAWVRGVANSARRWDEQIYDTQVRVDGNVAQVWAPYTFYVDKQLRHCGVNAIELLKDATGWKITQLSDTRRREGCKDVLAK